MKTPIVALALCLVAAPAVAQERACPPVWMLLDDYYRLWSEAPVATGTLMDMGSTDTRGMLRAFMLLLSPDGSFTVLAVDDAGEACLIARGFNFLWLAPPAQMEPLAAPAAAPQ